MHSASIDHGHLTRTAILPAGSGIWELYTMVILPWSCNDGIGS